MGRSDIIFLRWTDGCCTCAEESPGSTRKKCQVTSGEGNLSESATDNNRLRVRVKRCGKSAPQTWQQVWQGKPHLEQDQIEKTHNISGVCFLGWSHEKSSDVFPR